MNDVQLLLTRAADAGGEFTPPPTDSLRNRASRQNRTRRITSVASVVVLVTAVAVALSLRAQHHSTTVPRFDANELPGQSGPVVTAKQLAGYHWGALPPAPIGYRDGATVVWTGSRLLVWGGDLGHEYFSDGASYDPSSRTWTRLPTAPLTGRADAAAAWVDGRLMIWGGQDANGWQSDGASFDPTTGRWAALPPAPLPAEGAQGYAVGGDFIVTTSRAGDAARVRAARYDSRAQVWNRLPDLSIAAGDYLDGTTGLSVGPTLLLWTYWYRSTNTGPQSYSFGAGVKAYALQNDAWVSAPVAPEQGASTGYPLWTGTTLLLAGEQTYCGLCNPPPPSALAGEQISPASGPRTRIPVAPRGAFGPFLWTGGALLAIGVAGTLTGSDGADRTHSGVWEPATRAWTVLPPAPDHALDPSDAVWTGDRVLIWGGDGAAGGVEFAP